MAEVSLQQHDPAWRDSYEQVRERIQSAAGDGLLDVFHIGSTAVEGLLAKPVVDVAAVYETDVRVERATESLLGEFELLRDGDSRVVLTDGGNPGVVVHLQPQELQTWRRQLVLRELLREEPTARAKYEGAKLVAAEQYPDDVDGYTDAKAPVVCSLTERGFEAGYDTRLPTLLED